MVLWKPSGTNVGKAASDAAKSRTFAFMKYLIATLVFLAAELLYFTVAKKFNIVDRPNERSSHTQVTLLGGGIIFLLALLYFGATHAGCYPWLLVGGLLIAVVSYIDDIRQLPAWHK